MFELFFVVIFLWLSVKVIGLTIRMTWSAAKLAASILIGLAMPILIISLLFIGGMALLVPVVMIAIAACIVKACT